MVRDLQRNARFFVGTKGSSARGRPTSKHGHRSPLGKHLLAPRDGLARQALDDACDLDGTGEDPLRQIGDGLAQFTKRLRTESFLST
jgi:hypothetical protein